MSFLEVTVKVVWLQDVRDRMSLLKEISAKRQLERSWVLLRKKGKETPGVDEITLSEYEKNLNTNLKNLAFKIKSRKYRFSAAIEKSIPKKGTSEKRQINIFTIEDKIVQKSIQCSFERVRNGKSLFPEINNDISVGFLKGTPGIKRAVERIKNYAKLGYRIVTVADIKKFFEIMDTDILRRKIFERLGQDSSANWLIEQTFHPEIIKQDLISTERSALASTRNGVTQGSILAPLYSNIYMAGFDEQISNNNILAIRYADDMAILARNLTEAKKNLAYASEVLKTYSLEFHDSGKKRPSHRNLADAVHYLGIVFSLDKGGIWSLHPTEEKVILMKDDIKKQLNPKSASTLWYRTSRLNRAIRSWFSVYASVGCGKAELDSIYETISEHYSICLQELLFSRKIIQRKLSRSQFEFLGVLPPIDR